MIKYIFLSLLSTSIIFASDANPIKIKILEKIFTNIYTKKEIKIWSDENNILLALKKQTALKVVDNCNNASILLVQNKSTLPNNCKSKHIFVLRYKLLNDLPQSFGALFWKKGRPNIVIIEPRISNQSISISNALEPYLEDKVW